MQLNILSGIFDTCVSPNKLEHNFLIESLTKDLYYLEHLENHMNYSHYALFVVKQFFELKNQYKISQTLKLPKINWTTYDKTNLIWNDLINELVFFGEICIIPLQNIKEMDLLLGITKSTDYDEIEKYVNLAENIRIDFNFELIYQTLFNSNMFSIDHIPLKYQTDEMIEKILPEINENNSKILKWLKPTLKVNTKILELCDIKNIPYDLHNYESCLKAIKKNPENLAIINHNFINDTILNTYFKHQLLRHITRSERFSIIRDFDEARIIKILQYRPMLISHLTDKQRTYNLLKSLVTFDGYSLQYFTKEEMLYNDKEFVKIALKTEPNAKKYLLN